MFWKGRDGKAMLDLITIEQNTLRMMEDLKWSQKEVDDLVDKVNKTFKKRENLSDDDTDNSLVVHNANYSGGFILFGGWTKIFDHTIPSGTRGHELYLAFGGVGAGGWSGDCDIELLEEGSIIHDGKTYVIPQNYYDKGNDWDSYQTGFAWFHDHVKSFMFMYLPQFIQPIPVFVYFDSGSNRIGISVPNCSFSTGIGGGTVKVEG